MSDPQIRFGPFALDVDPVRLRRGSDSVELRPKSLKVLHYLAARPGRLVTKGELFERVWSGRAVSESGLRLCVREIRAALEDNAGAPHYLETIVGRGYRFLVDKKYDRWFESELHRLQGELELESDNGGREVAADCFARSLRVAREQQARSLELRAALSLSRHWLRQGRSREAFELLEPISAWFPAALASRELADARSLLRQQVL